LSCNLPSIGRTARSTSAALSRDLNPKWWLSISPERESRNSVETVRPPELAELDVLELLLLDFPLLLGLLLVELLLPEVEPIPRALCELSWPWSPGSSALEMFSNTWNICKRYLVISRKDLWLSEKSRRAISICLTRGQPACSRARICKASSAVR
jgi:hypothetical protein